MWGGDLSKTSAQRGGTYLRGGLVERGLNIAFTV